MSIDHKAQWRGNAGIGNYLEIWVKVLTKYILLMQPLGTSKWLTGKYFSRFKYEINNNEYKCINYEVNRNSISDELKGYYDIDSTKSCLLYIGKSGKYKLKMTFMNQFEKDPKKGDMADAIDMIIGL